jgi:ATP-binding cassette subfamily F protein uup
LVHLLNVQNLSKHYGEKTLFEEAAFAISPGDRIAIVGVNGSGKTTLLKILTDQEPPDAGEVEWNPTARIEYLPQNPIMPEDVTVLDYLFQSDTPLMELLRDYEAALQSLTKNPTDAALQSRLTRLNQRMDMENGWAAEANAKAVLTRLGITEFDSPVGLLSGGQRRRVAMARALLEPSDLLIMDEPTNHIDPDTIVWLEDYLADWKSALLLVTHDRYFLDRVVNQILEIDRGRIHTHPGNYSAFLEGKTARESTSQKMELDRSNILKRELDWLSRAPMARGGKQKARIQRIETMQETRYHRPGDELTINIASRRTGKQIMEISHLTKRFDDQTVLDDFSYVINRGDRLGIIGPNGSGKSTLLNLIAGRLKPDAGEIATGATIHIGYYDQLSTGLDESQRVIDNINDVARVIQTAKGEPVTASQMLDRFQFSYKDQYSYISTLSGGERRRL